MPVFTLANPKGEPLQYERDGKPLAVFFADVAAAEEELGRADTQHPQLGLSVLPVGMGAAFDNAKRGGAILVPCAGELDAARDPDGGGWDDSAIPLFGCLQMRKPGADGASTIPLFMSSADAQEALARASAASPGADLQLVCCPLARAIEMIVTGEQTDFEILPPTDSIKWMQAWQARGESGATLKQSTPASLAAQLASQAIRDDRSATSGGPGAGIFPG